jgi:hypothetical protein
MRLERLPATVRSTGAKALSTTHVSGSACLFRPETLNILRRTRRKARRAGTLGNLTRNDFHGHLTLHEPSADFRAATSGLLFCAYAETRYPPPPLVYENNGLAQARAPKSLSNKGL